MFDTGYRMLAQTVKRLPAMRETQVWFLGREDPMEKEMTIHSSTLAWKIPWTEEPDRLQSMGSQRVGHDWATSLTHRMLGAGARGWSKEMIWGGRWEGGSGLGTHVHPWLIHVNVWQNQYSIVKQNKVKIKIKKKKIYKWPTGMWKSIQHH